MVVVKNQLPSGVGTSEERESNDTLVCFENLQPIEGDTYHDLRRKLLLANAAASKSKLELLNVKNVVLTLRQVAAAREEDNEEIVSDMQEMIVAYKDAQNELEQMAFNATQYLADLDKAREQIEIQKTKAQNEALEQENKYKQLLEKHEKLSKKMLKVQKERDEAVNKLEQLAVPPRQVRRMFGVQGRTNSQQQQEALLSQRVQTLEADLKECSGVVEQLAVEKKKHLAIIRTLQSMVKKCLCGAARSHSVLVMGPTDPCKPIGSAFGIPSMFGSTPNVYSGQGLDEDDLDDDADRRSRSTVARSSSATFLPQDGSLETFNRFNQDLKPATQAMNSCVPAMLGKFQGDLNVSGDSHLASLCQNNDHNTPLANYLKSGGVVFREPRRGSIEHPPGTKNVGVEDAGSVMTIGTADSDEEEPASRIASGPFKRGFDAAKAGEDTKEDVDSCRARVGGPREARPAPSTNSSLEPLAPNKDCERGQPQTPKSRRSRSMVMESSAQLCVTLPVPRLIGKKFEQDTAAGNLDKEKEPEPEVRRPRRVSITGATFGRRNGSRTGRIMVTLPVRETVVPTNVLRSYWGSKVFGPAQLK